MIFNSVTFLVFLGVVIALYWALPTKPRLWMLFLASVTFYGFWRFEYVPVMMLSAVVDYLVALRLHRTENDRRRLGLLLVSLTINLGLLFYFKYLMFAADNVWAGLGLLGVASTPPALDILLPLGISFYTFQTISYTIDVYRRQIEPVQSFVLYGCYVTFFPQLVAGPILRCAEVTPQLERRPRFRSEDVAEGARRVIAGLFLKVVLADNLASLVDLGFAQDAHTLSALDVWTLAFLFGYQIYFDFSAYSHIGIGAARMMGITFPENFDHPYAASSPKEFWGRWHISLSSWIRDYLYLPLTGAPFRGRSTGGLATAASAKELSQAKRTRALFMTWAIMGFWHGANWTFVFWGVFHAMAIWGYRKAKPVRDRFRPGLRRELLGWAITFPLMMLSWVPFRANDLGHTFSLYARVLDPGAYLWLGMRENTHLVAFVVTVLTIGTAVVSKRALPTIKARRSLWVLTETIGLTVMLGLVFVFLRPIAQFIYFQF